MSGEPKTRTPQAMTLEEGLAAIFPDTIGRRGDGKWPFFTYVNDEHGHTCTAIFDSWPEAVSWAKGVRVVARDEAAELRAAVQEWANADRAVDEADRAWNDAIDTDRDDDPYKAAWTRALERLRVAENALLRLAGGENEK